MSSFTRILGRTGQQVSVIGLGGWHLGGIDESDAIRIMHAAIDEGVTFFDNAWDYHDGVSEERMGKALAMDNRRNRVFLMTKNCGRDYDQSMRCLEESLRRLRTDHIDLWQFHEIVYDNDPEWIFERGGIKAAVEAQKAGKVRYTGFTGHKHPQIHLDMLSRPHEWDTVQMPVNILDECYRSFRHHVMPVCQTRNIAVIGMKGACGGFPNSDLIGKMGLTAEDCYRYCLSQPIATQVMGITTIDQLRENVRIAREFQPLSNEELQALIARVVGEAADGRHELFKSGQQHDGPYHRQQHGFALA